MEKQSFLRNHADTIAIIGVNLGIALVLISIYLSNISSRIDIVENRIDKLYIIRNDQLRECKK